MAFVCDFLEECGFSVSTLLFDGVLARMRGAPCIISRVVDLAKERYGVTLKVDTPRDASGRGAAFREEGCRDSATDSHFSDELAIRQTLPPITCRGGRRTFTGDKCAAEAHRPLTLLVYTQRACVRWEPVLPSDPTTMEAESGTPPKVSGQSELGL